MLFLKNGLYFPCQKNGKIPAVKGKDAWRRTATGDKTKVQAWLKAGYNIGLYCAGSGVVVVDVDLNKPGVKPAWLKFIKAHGCPKTLTVRSARGGLHLYFKKDKTRDYNGRLIFEGVQLGEIKNEGYVLLPPSRFVDEKGVGGAYEVVRRIPYNDRLPKSWEVYCYRQELKKSNKKKERREFNVDHLMSIAEQLQTKEFDYAMWVRLGMALHAETGGADEGLEVWKHISEGVNYRSGDDYKCEVKWAGFKDEKPGGITGATFIHEARGLGCDIGEKFSADDFFEDESQVDGVTNDESLTEVQKQELADAKGLELPKEESIFETDSYTRLVTDNLVELIKWVNKQGFATLGGDKTGHIIKTYKGVDGCLNFIDLPSQNYKTALAHIKFKRKDTEKMKFEVKDSSKIWIESQFKKHYLGIVFQEKTPKGFLNLGGANPIPCVGVQGDVKPALNFIHRALCNGNAEKTKFLINWLAHLVQRPYEKTSIVPVLIGGEGTGKGLLTMKIMKAILQSRHAFCSSPEEITHNFNKHLAYKFLTVLDEACWRGDKKAQSKLRHLTGENTMMVEEKFGAKYEMPNYSRYIILSNRDDAVEIQATNRRYLIIENSDKYRKHQIHKDAFHAFEKENLSEKFYWFLKHRDLSDFDPAEFPAHLDDGGLATKLGYDVFKLFLWDFLYENPKPVFYGSNKLHAGLWFEAFKDFLKQSNSNIKNISQKKFSMEMQKLCPILKARGGSKTMRFEGLVFKGFFVTVSEICNGLTVTLNIKPVDGGVIDAELFEAKADL